MEPDEAKVEWQKDQLQRSDLPPRLHSAVHQLLSNWNNSYLGLSSAGERQQALDAFYKLAQNQALTTKEDAHVWEPVKPGNIYRADKVRVQYNAYEGEPGRVHNGRLGTVVAIRNGDIIVKYTDTRSPAFEAVHHSPYKLERSRAQ